MKVPQWRKDVLEWADKRGYKETGGGLWGELDGESAENLTRPTRYFVLTVSTKVKLPCSISWGRRCCVFVQCLDMTDCL